jgi:hypothetical protein
MGRTGIFTKTLDSVDPRWPHSGKYLESGNSCHCQPRLVRPWVLIILLYMSDICLDGKQEACNLQSTLESPVLGSQASGRLALIDGLYKVAVASAGA